MQVDGLGGPGDRGDEGLGAGQPGRAPLGPVRALQGGGGHQVLADGRPQVADGAERQEELKDLGPKKPRDVVQSAGAGAFL